MKGFKQAYDVLTGQYASFSAFLMHLLSGVVVRRLIPGMGTDQLIPFLRSILGQTDQQIQNECTRRAGINLASWEPKAVQWKGFPSASSPTDLLALPDTVADQKYQTEDMNTKRLLPDFAAYGAVAEDFKNGDIPAFYQVYGRRELMNSSGQLITATASTQTPQSQQTVQQLYPWAPVIANGEITNITVRPQVVVQSKAFQNLVEPARNNYQKFIADVASALNT